MTISVVVPVYNAEQTLAALVEAVGRLGEIGLVEMILVNDGSRDRSWEVIERLAAEHSWIRGINLMRNFGQHNALLCGIRAASGEIIVTMDDDLENSPEEVPRLLAKLNEGYDVVYGTPVKEMHGWLRDAASRLTKVALQSTMGASTARSVSAFRAFRRELRGGFDRYSGPYVSIDVLLTWSTDRFSAIPVENRPRAAGVSNYTLRKLVIHALNMVTGFTTVPLRIASILGFLFTLFGMGILVLVVLRYLIAGGSVPGFSFLASIIAIFSGVQLFALGVIGEYVARVHARTMERPSYAIRVTTGSDAERV
jgi:glycosyltransferase involved in cell wall biosynthesis